MALADDLVGLGLPSILASHTASGGTGTISVSSAGSAFASGTVIKKGQRFISVTDSDGTKGVSLPTVGGATLLGDMFIINNAGTSALKVFASSGVVIAVGGSNTSSTSIPTCVSLLVMPVSTTQWAGLLGA